MEDKLKQEIITDIELALPDANGERINSLLELIISEVQSYNACGKTIEWNLLKSVIIEVLYQSLKSEAEPTVSSVKRGDMTISYVAQSKEIRGLLNNYADLIKRLIGCEGVRFF